MGALLSDVRYAVRGLAARPGFTLAAVAALGLGLGATTAIFSVVDAVVLSPLPYRDPGRLLTLWESDAAQGIERDRLSPVNFLDFRAEEVLADAAAWWHPEINLTDDRGEPVRATAIETSGNLFAVLGVEPRLGPGFKSPEELHDEAPEVVISHRLWTSRYGADPGIVGRPIRLNGEPYAVVGVMPPGFQFPGETDLWARLNWNLANHTRHAHFMGAVARLAPGVELDTARATLAGVAGRLEAEFPASNRGRGVHAEPLQAEVVGAFRPALLVLFAAVGLLLLLASANVANLLLARASARGREVAIRAALGASRWRLLRLFTIESLLLGVLGAATGLGLAWAGVKLLVAAPPLDVPRLAEVAVDGRVLGFGLAAALATVLLFGLAPAFHSSRADLQGTLREGGRGTGAAPVRQRARAALVVAEVALAVMLLVGAGLLARSFMRLLAEEPGFDPGAAMTANVELPSTLYDDWRGVGRFYGELVERLAAHPAVAAAGATGFLPLEAGWRIDYQIPGRPPLADGETPEAQHVTVTPGYFEAMGIPLVAGRTFDRRDTEQSPGAVVISRELARRAWPDEEAVGKTLISAAQGIGPLGRSLRESREWEVVGVVGDVKNAGLEAAVEPAVYLPQTQFPYRSMHVVVRGRGATAAQLAAVLREEVRRLDPGLALTEARPIATLLADSTARPRVVAFLMTSFAALALALAAVGIYGVLSYAVAQRRGEIGVRLALGATPGRVRRLVVREGMVLAALGLALGLAASVALARFLESLLYGVEPGDLPAFAVALAAILGAAWLACELPARRAARVDPLEALRSE